MLPVADRVSPVRSSALPSFRSAVLPCRVPGQVLEEVHADILEFRTDQPEAEEENPHVVLRALGAEGTLVFRACVPLKARTSTVPVRHTLFRLIAL